MSAFEAALKAEITRIARKEGRAVQKQLRTLSGHYRREIAALKQKIAALEKQLGRSAGKAGRAAPAPATDGAEGDDGAKARRFSATRLAAQRAKLGLSAQEFGQLIGVSDQTIYKWESGKVRPRAAQLDAIVESRKHTKATAAAALAEKA